VGEPHKAEQKDKSHTSSLADRLTHTHKVHAEEQVKGILGGGPYIPLYRPCKSSLFFDAFFYQTQRREIRNNTHTHTHTEREREREGKRNRTNKSLCVSHFKCSTRSSVPGIRINFFLYENHSFFILKYYVHLHAHS